MLGEHFLGQLLAEIGAEAVLHDLDLAGSALDDAVSLGGIHVRAGIAGSSHDAAPVGVAAEHGSLEQHGAGDGLGDQAGVMLGGQAVSLDLDQVSGALAVGSDAAGDVDADMLDQAGKRSLVFLGLDLNAGGAVGQQEDGVVGGGVAVDGAHVEALVDRRGEHLLQVGSVSLGVGGDVNQHGGHVGVDHTGALGHRADTDGTGGQLQLIGGFLLLGVGGHDGPGSVRALFGGHVGDDAAHAVEHLLDRKSLADHAGGADENLILAQAQQLFRLGLDSLGILDALLAGGGVGVAAVDDDGAGLALLEDLSVEDDGRCAELVRGEAGRAGGGILGIENGHVRLFGLAALDAGINCAGGIALRGGHAAAFNHFVCHLLDSSLKYISEIRCFDQGYMAGYSRPVVSGIPMIRFMFWMAWPAAPLPMLSITLETIRRWVRAS